MKSTLKITLKIYFLSHAREALNAFKELFNTKIATAMTISVIGIALALPSSFLLILTNVKSMMRILEGSPQISVFLKDSISESQKQMLEKKFKEDPMIGSVTYASKEDALKEFSKSLNMMEMAHLLHENPLPASFTLQLKPALPNQTDLEIYLQSLKTLPDVLSIEMDLEWLQRLSKGFNVAERLITGLTVLLALAVLMVIGNTLRLHIENKRDIIEVSKWVGATDAFVRRPFLYLGLWYGLLGSAIALLIVLVFSLWLGKPVLDLLSFYSTSVVLKGLDFHNSGLLCLLGALLGLGGAFLSVGKELRAFRPS